MTSTQGDGCPFCGILAGTEPVVDLEWVAADVARFRPRGPVNDSHRLWIHAVHTDRLGTSPLVTAHLVAVVARTMGDRRYQVFINNGQGQTIDHVHVHTVEADPPIRWWSAAR